VFLFGKLPSEVVMMRRSGVDHSKVLTRAASSAGLAIAMLVAASPAYAHHATGGRTPSTALEGFLSGLAHPVLGLDHFAFVVAVGLVAALYAKGALVPILFAAAALLGTGWHLLAPDVPGPEIAISLSILIVGFVLARGKSSPLVAVGALAAVAGLFHGYAYGESIVGATMKPLFAYLAGFTVIQAAISLASFRIGCASLGEAAGGRSLAFRIAGVVVSGVGALFLTSSLLS
jgi:urease accessory protein